MNMPTPNEALSDANAVSGSDLACVVLTWNASPRVRDTVESLLDQSVRLEIVVVNSGYGDPFRLVEPFRDSVRVLHHGGHLRSGAARNLGIRATAAPFIAFLPCNFAAENDWAHRLIESHQAHPALAGEICRPESRSPVGLAYALLEQSSRLSGAGSEPRMDHWASYSRTLFERYGYFCDDLHASADQEFQRRIRSDLTVHRCSESKGRNKQTHSIRNLPGSQYRRGARAGRGLEETGKANLEARCWRVVNRRLSRRFRTHWRHAGVRNRTIAALALPLMLSGAVAYSVGARRSGYWNPTPSPAPSLSIDQEAPGIHALLQVRNGMRFLPGYLANLEGKVNGVIALDDGSTDGTREFLQNNKLVCRLIRNPCLEPHNWDEVGNRRKLIAAALSMGATWVIAVDVDERLPCDFTTRFRVALKRAGTEDLAAFAVWMREVWDRPDTYRIDGAWGSKTVARLFNVQAGVRYDNSELHGQWAPLNGRKAGKFTQADLEIFHLGMMQKCDRLRRRRKYEQLDPDRRWQSIGYEHLTDERGCVCATIGARKMYQPAVSEMELDHVPPGILALLTFHNEARFLPGYLDNVAPQVDGIIALDDGSTDGSADILQSHPKVLELISNPVASPHEWNENANQRRLIETAGRHDPDWLLVVDADERLERHFRDRANGIVRLAESRGVKALSVAFRELWGSPHTYRTDGTWGRKRKASLFKYRRDHEFDDRPLHNYWAPLNSRINGEYVHADLELYHLRMIDPKDREARRARYRRLDPDEKWQRQGYKYLVDETGIELETPDPDRHYMHGLTDHSHAQSPVMTE